MFSSPLRYPGVTTFKLYALAFRISLHDLNCGYHIRESEPPFGLALSHSD
jgi:hypothetical protein